MMMNPYSTSREEIVKATIFVCALILILALSCVFIVLSVDWPEAIVIGSQIEYDNYGRPHEELLCIGRCSNAN